MAELVFKRSPFEEKVIILGINGMKIHSKICNKENQTPAESFIEFTREEMIRLCMAMQKQILNY